MLAVVIIIYHMTGQLTSKIVLTGHLVRLDMVIMIRDRQKQTYKKRKKRRKRENE